jgi:hypothetical protein
VDGIELNVIVADELFPIAVAIDSKELGFAGVTELEADETADAVP